MGGDKGYKKLVNYLHMRAAYLINDKRNESTCSPVYTHVKLMSPADTINLAFNDNQSLTWMNTPLLASYMIGL